MRIRVGCEMTYQLGQATPMIVMLNVHASRVSDLERPDYVITMPSVPLEGYRDSFGNWCNRLVAPSGPFSLRTDTIVRRPRLRPTGPSRCRSRAASGSEPARRHVAVSAREPVLRNRPPVGRGVAAVRDDAARLGAGAGDLQLRSRPYHVRLRRV